MWSDWLQKFCALHSLPNQEERDLNVDNFSSPVKKPDVMKILRETWTRLYKRPGNEPDLVQSGDSLIFQKIKAVWRRGWKQHKFESIRADDWQKEEIARGSGKLCCPEKVRFLKHGAKFAPEVNRMNDSSVLSYARKAMVQTGLSLDKNGLWSEARLTHELQCLIAKQRNHLDGEIVCAADVEAWSSSVVCKKRLKRTSFPLHNLLALAPTLYALDHYKMWVASKCGPRYVMKR